MGRGVLTGRLIKVGAQPLEIDVWRALERRHC
jgi:hypothetical protein